MYTTIQKWGNSHAVRLPKGVLEVAALRENDPVEIKTEHNYIIIKRANIRHKTLKERLADYDGECICSEWDSGKHQGNEVL